MEISNMKNYMFALKFSIYALVSEYKIPPNYSKNIFFLNKYLNVAYHF